MENPNPSNTYSPTNFPNGLTTLFNGLTKAPGLEIVGGSGSALVNNANFFTLIYNDTASFVLAHATFPVLGGGNLAFDNGTVPPSTLSCRMYTFLATVEHDGPDATVTITVVNGSDFIKGRKMHPSSDITYGSTQTAVCPLGYLYVKNESNAVFIPGTTHLDASGITALFTDAYGYPVWVPSQTPQD